MAIADHRLYLQDIATVLRTHWPANRTVNIVCHGHSVPSGYFATPMVDTFNSYPHLLHLDLKNRFPFAVINVIVTAIGGENSTNGAARFGAEVLCHRPDVVTIDYGLNDRGIGLDQARANWDAMLQQALGQGAKVILLTPTPDVTQLTAASAADRKPLQDHAAQIRELAVSNSVGLVDSLTAFAKYQESEGDLTDLLSWSNHPNRLGHEIVARELLRWFPAA